MRRFLGRMRYRIFRTDVCTCPKCGYTQVHKRGLPCDQIKCPKCGTLMKGEYC